MKAKFISFAFIIVLFFGIISLLNVSDYFSATAEANTGGDTCYLNTIFLPDESFCFACLLVQNNSVGVCTTPCGSIVCAGVPKESE